MYSDPLLLSNVYLGGLRCSLPIFKVLSPYTICTDPAVYTCVLLAQCMYEAKEQYHTVLISVITFF
jgi:hypothetical protein